MSFLKLFIVTCLSLLLFIALTFIMLPLFIGLVAGGIALFYYTDNNAQSFMVVSVLAAYIMSAFITYLFAKKIAKKININPNQPVTKIIKPNFNPFTSSNTLIHQLYPEDSIKLSRWALSWNLFTVSKIYSVPIGFSLPNILPKVVRAIETDKGYFIDSRLYDLVTFIPGLIIAYFVYIFVTQSILHTNLNFFQDIPNSFIMIMIIIMVTFLLIQQFHIKIIRKSWLTKDEIKRKRLFLEGTIPENTSLVYYQTGPSSEYFKETYFLF